MELLTEILRAKLLQNGELRRDLARGGRAEADFYPVVKLMMPFGGMTWLLTEYTRTTPISPSGFATSAWDSQSWEMCGSRNLRPCGARGDYRWSATSISPPTRRSAHTRSAPAFFAISKLERQNSALERHPEREACQLGR